MTYSCAITSFIDLIIHNMDIVKTHVALGRGVSVPAQKTFNDNFDIKGIPIMVQFILNWIERGLSDDMSVLVEILANMYATGVRRRWVDATRTTQFFYL